MFKAIQTALMNVMGGSEIAKQCRKVEIVADAAYAILGKPVSYTGQFVIDEDVLKKEGIKDFDVYAVEPGKLFLTFCPDTSIYFCQIGLIDFPFRYGSV